MVAKSSRRTYDTPPVPEEDPNIFYPEEDGEPMADNDDQRRAIVYASEALGIYFQDRLDVYVSADILIYYRMNEVDSRVAPDLLVSFGVSDHNRGSYFVWREDKPPDFVMEVASPRTYLNDVGVKRDIYAGMGVTEYWRFDPKRGMYFQPPLVGERLNRRGEYEPRDLIEADGILRGYSAALGLDVCVRDWELRFFDPARGLWLQSHKEDYAGRLNAEAERNSERERADSAEEQVAMLHRVLREHGITPPGGP